jgi:hypothetical protein
MSNQKILQFAKEARLTSVDEEALLLFAQMVANDCLNGSSHINDNAKARLMASYDIPYISFKQRLEGIEASRRAIKVAKEEFGRTVTINFMRSPLNLKEL